jgi:hypothetical protein
MDDFRSRGRRQRKALRLQALVQDDFLDAHIQLVFVPGASNVNIPRVFLYGIPARGGGSAGGSWVNVSDMRILLGYEGWRGETGRGRGPAGPPLSSPAASSTSAGRIRLPPARISDTAARGGGSRRTISRSRASTRSNPVTMSWTMLALVPAVRNARW